MASSIHLAPTPPPPPAVAFSDAQLRVLTAVADTVFQAHSGPELERILANVPEDAFDWQKEHVHRYATSPLSSFPGAIPWIISQLTVSVAPSDISQILLVLTLLDTRIGTAALAAPVGIPVLTSFPQLDVQTRERILIAWKQHPISLIRKLGVGFTAIPIFASYCHVPEIALAIGYPFNGDPTREGHRKEGRVKETHKYVFEVPTGDWTTFSTDFLVVGSGAGGGVVSAQIAKSGHQVLVVEKGKYVPNDELPGRPSEGFKELYERDGVIVSDDASINVLAGATFGGGTTVNWSASIRPQHFVRTEWANEHGLKYFLSKGFEDSMSAVCDRMGVSADHLVHNKGNQLLINGSRAAGYHADSIPQNTGGQSHSCGFCGYGCPYNEKQGSAATWLKDASSHGAKFIQQARVDTILFAPPPARPSDEPKFPTSAANLSAFKRSKTNTRAVGAVLSFPDGTHAVVKARKGVVVSGGSINTPATLLRSGLTSKWIGNGLRLHPVTVVTGYFDETINPWDGSIMTALSNASENRLGTNYGAKIEVIASASSTYATLAVPWRGSAAHKALAVRYPKSVTFIILTRDRDGGRVYIRPDGEAAIDYTVSEFDSESMLEGLVAASRIMYASGARTIVTPQTGVLEYERKDDGTAVAEPGYKLDGLANPDFEKWLAKVKKAGCVPTWTSMGSAHQMASCSMGTKRTNSAVDPRGRVWDSERLWVADASVFPTASGANPMVTTMSVSHSIGRFIVEDVAKEENQSGKSGSAVGGITESRL